MIMFSHKDFDVVWDESIEWDAKEKSIVTDDWVLARKAKED